MKSLIIYFTHTGENYLTDGIKNINKGNTEVVAEKLQSITNADIFRVEEEKTYPYNYKECCDVAKEELNKNLRPNIKNKIHSIDEYETIYICSPIWWGHLPMVMFSALEELNWNGKRVSFIITHEGSGVGSIPSDIEKICKNAYIDKSLAIRGSNVELCSDKLKEWIGDNNETK